MNKLALFLTGVVGIFGLNLGTSTESKTAQDFRARCAALAGKAEKADTMTVAGKNEWLFLGKELRHIGVGQFWGPEALKVSKADKPEHADPLPAILDFHSQLKNAGIELVLVPVPPKALIYPDMVLDGVTMEKGSPPRLDEYHLEFYDLLRKEGVQVLDLTAAFLSARADPDKPLYCKQDTHWSGFGCVRAAQAIAARIKDRPWLMNQSRLKPTSEFKNVEILGDLREGLKSDKPAAEQLTLGFVGAKNGSDLTPIEPDRASPVILLGDSHTLVFHAGGDMLAKGAGLADHLAMELGLAVDLIGVRGSGATPARVNLVRRARAQADYLAGKKIVIWCFGAREFTESTGWQKLPLLPR